MVVVVVELARITLKVVVEVGVEVLEAPAVLEVFILVGTAEIPQSKAQLKAIGQVVGVAGGVITLLLEAMVNGEEVVVEVGAIRSVAVPVMVVMEVAR
jgi:hypothetical protein